MRDDPRTIEALQAETRQLRQRVAELEQKQGAVPTQDELQMPIPYQQLFEVLPMPMLILRADGTMVDINRRNQELINTSREVLVGNYNVLADQESMDQGYLDAFRRALDGEVIVMSPTMYDAARAGIDPEATPVWSETICFPLHNADGTVGYVAVLNRDVTEQMQMIGALQQSEDRFRTIVENVPSGICITNQDGMFEYVNPAYCTIYGYTEEELIDQPFTVVVPEERKEWAQDLHKTFLEERKEIPADWIVINKHGEPLNIMASAAYLTGEDGQPRKATFVLDITDRKRAEESSAALQQQIINAQQERLRELSTPLIPISDNVVIMPLIGSIDSARAQMVMEALLEGVSHYQAELAIIDITGVVVVDTQVAQALMQAAQSVRLLGARVMLTGIQPQIAQTLVHLGVDLGAILTRSSLQAGIAHALGLFSEQ